MQGRKVPHYVLHKLTNNDYIHYNHQNLKQGTSTSVNSSISLKCHLRYSNGLTRCAQSATAGRYILKLWCTQNQNKPEEMLQGEIVKTSTASANKTKPTKPTVCTDILYIIQTPSFCFTMVQV